MKSDISFLRTVLLEHKRNVRVNAQLGGGSLRDVGCYPVNMVGMLLNDYSEQICIQKTEFQGVDLALSAVLKYKNGVMASIHSGFDSSSAQITEIYGTRSSIIVRDSFTDVNGRDTPIRVILGDGFGIIGASGIAVKFYEAIELTDGVEVWAVGSKSLERARTSAEENGLFKFYGDYEKMLKKSEIDTVYLVTTGNFHYENCLLCIEYGKAVLCEKSTILPKIITALKTEELDLIKAE